MAERPIKTEPGGKAVRTASPFACGPACGLLAHVKGDVLVRVEPGDFPGTGHICARGLAYPKLVYHPERLKYPMKRQGSRGEGKWQRVSWDEALDTIAARFREISSTYGPSSLAWVMDLMGILTVDALLEFIGACQGTFVLPAGCGDSAGPCADRVCYGSPWWYGEDYTTRFDKPALCVVWGNNPADTDFFKWRNIRDAKENGAKLVVIDPRFSTTASKADVYVPIKPGIDTALALAMMNVILDRGLHDISFICDHTVGPFLVRSDNGMFVREKDFVSGGSEKYVVWDSRSDMPKCYDASNVSPALVGSYRAGVVDCKPAFQLLRELVAQYPPDRASEITGVPADAIARLAVAYANTRPAASYRGMGCQRTFHGDITFHAINTLAAITGNISFEGHATFELNHVAFLSRGVPNLLPLMQLYEAIRIDKPYPVRALWIARHNPVNQDPNFNKMINELIPRLEFIVVADMFMTTSAQYADLVLPVCSFFECTDLISPVGNGSHNYLQLQQKVIEPLYESRSDIQIIASLAEKMGMEGFLKESPEELIKILLASGHPSMDGVTLEKLKETPMLPAAQSLPHFATPSGRLEFYTEKLKGFGQELPVYLEPLEGPSTPAAQRYPLSLLTTHTKYRTHSMFANVAWLREMDHEPALEMNSADANPRSIMDGDLIRVYNDRGEVRLRAKVHQGIRPGVVNICQGWSPGDYFTGTHQALTHDTINPVQQAIYEPNASLYDVRVEVEKVKEA